MRNKKGFAISGILYSILVLFLVMLVAVLTLFANQKTLMDKTKLQVLNELNNYKEGSGGDASADIEAIMQLLVPKGTVQIFTGQTAPEGFLLCDGSAISRTTYAELFAVIGTSYGTGNGSTTFNLPDMRGKVTVGKSTETEFNTIGKVGGEKTHTLTINEMPSHSHNIPSLDVSAWSGSHTHTMQFLLGGGTESWGYEWSSNPAITGPLATSSSGVGVSSITVSGQKTTATTAGNTGGSQPHNNLQPYTVVNYVIRY